MRLPQSIQEMSGLIGLPAALALVNAYGGLILRVPTGKRVGGKVESDLLALLGAESAKALIFNYGGQRISIARCCGALRDARDQKIIAEYGAGTSVRSLSKRHGMTDRNVRNILKRAIPPSEYDAPVP